MKKGFLVVKENLRNPNIIIECQGHKYKSLSKYQYLKLVEKKYFLLEKQMIQDLLILKRINTRMILNCKVDIKWY
jgi:hypothetical protein